MTDNRAVSARGSVMGDLFKERSKCEDAQVGVGGIAPPPRDLERDSLVWWKMYADIPGLSSRWPLDLGYSTIA
ncbi:hypothetical protein MTO96_014073 [Rhipicephalus appendiculatus]